MKKALYDSDETDRVAVRARDTRDPAAVLDLWERVQPVARKSAGRWGRHEAETGKSYEDYVQQAAVSLLVAIKSYSGDTKNYSFIHHFRLKMNTEFVADGDGYRRKWIDGMDDWTSFETPIGREGLTLGETLPAPSADDDSELSPELQQAIDKLPTQQKEAVVACWVEGVIPERYAERCGRDSQGVRRSLNRARARLQKALKNTHFQPVEGDLEGGGTDDT